MGGREWGLGSGEWGVGNGEWGMGGGEWGVGSGGIGVRLLLALYFFSAAVFASRELSITCSLSFSIRSMSRASVYLFASSEY